MDKPSSFVHALKGNREFAIRNNGVDYTCQQTQLILKLITCAYKYVASLQRREKKLIASLKQLNN